MSRLSVILRQTKMSSVTNSEFISTHAWRRQEPCLGIIHTHSRIFRRRGMKNKREMTQNISRKMDTSYSNRGGG